LKWYQIISEASIFMVSDWNTILAHETIAMFSNSLAFSILGSVFAGTYLGPWGFAATFVGSIIAKELLFRMASDSGLKGSFVGALFSWAYGFITAMKQVVALGITCISEFLKASDVNFWKS
jgi:hypothetical protein